MQARVVSHMVGAILSACLTATQTWVSTGDKGLGIRRVGKVWTGVANPRPGRGLSGTGGSREQVAVH